MDTKLKRFLDLSVRADAEWQGGFIRLADIVRASKIAKPMANAAIPLWIACESDLVQASPSIEPGKMETLLNELLEFSESKGFGYRPAKITVTDQEIAGQLQKLFLDSGTTIAWNQEPEVFCEFKASMADHFSEASSAPALLHAECSDAQMRAFAQAAAAFYRARPWQYLGDMDLLQVHSPKPPKFLKYAMVMGAGGQQFGLGFYDSTAKHWKLRSQQLDLSTFEAFSLTFNPMSEAFEKDIAYWQELGIDIETGDAFPQFVFYSRGDTRSPSAKEVEFATVVLAAIAETTEAEMDSGKWSKSVMVDGELKECKLSIPDLVDPPDRKEWIRRGLTPEMRGNERHMRLIQQFVAQQGEIGSVEELNELINKKFAGSISEFDYPSETPFDRAENLCFEAIDNYGRRRIQLARLALQEDPTHIEAQVLLAESTYNVSERIELFRTAVELGKTKFAELLEQGSEPFWQMAETRPFIRAKYGLAHSLSLDGQANEAIAEMQDILRLNPNDNMGVRQAIIPLLLKQNREREAIQVLESYPEQSASWLYMKAQVEFRKGGPGSRDAAKALKAAIKFNPHVAELLRDDGPPRMPDQYTLGSIEEAAIVIEEQADSWSEIDGFEEWMVAGFQNYVREEMKHQRELQIKRKLIDQARKKSKKRR